VGAAVTQAIRPLQEKVDQIGNEVQDQGRRLAALEKGGVAPAARPSTAPAARPAAVRRKPVARPVARPAVRPSSNRIEILDGPASSAVVIARPSAVPASAPALSPAAHQKTSCNVSSALRGRAWIKKGDGSFASYGVGDTLPDGKTISDITENGIFVKGRAWSCE
jgi:hypothetical protein